VCPAAGSAWLTDLRPVLWLGARGVMHIGATPKIPAGDLQRRGWGQLRWHGGTDKAPRKPWSPAARWRFWVCGEAQTSHTRPITDRRTTLRGSLNFDVKNIQKRPDSIAPSSLTPYLKTEVPGNIFKSAAQRWFFFTGRPWNHFYQCC
jgi:hypothetical protein